MTVRTDRRILGAVVDDQTRCIHYRGPLDIVAIRFRCCGDFYPCFRCHAEAVDHDAEQWPRTSFDEPAICCGVCRGLLSIEDYLGTSACPHCSSGFNPRCSLHAELYFELPHQR